MSNSSHSKQELIATAVAAATAGAAIAYAAIKSQEKKVTATYKTLNNRMSMNSLIVNDSSSDPRLQSDILFPHNHEEKMKRRIAQRVSVEEENKTPRNSVTVRVPATSANVGPGYDCIGMAVDLWSEITVARADKFEITAEGEGAEDMPKDETNLMCIGLEAAFKAANKPVPPLKYHCLSRIPYARGLGSSSAAIVGGIIAGLVLAGHKLPCWGSEALLQIASDIEGHPDNVAPAIYGGLQIGIHNGTRWQTERCPHPSGMQAVLFIPDFIGKTSDARNVLKDTVSRSDAAYSIGRVAFLIHALCTANLDNLKYGVQDTMHQPQRGTKLYKYLYPMIDAAQNAGACCAYLSGAGPTVMALTSGASGDIFTQREKERTDRDVARAMLDVAKEFGISGQLLVTQPVHEGASVIDVQPPFSSDEITYRGNI
jgi:homoserine kinase